MLPARKAHGSHACKDKFSCPRNVRLSTLLQVLNPRFCWLFDAGRKCALCPWTVLPARQHACSR